MTHLTPLPLDAKPGNWVLFCDADLLSLGTLRRIDDDGTPNVQDQNGQYVGAADSDVYLDPTEALETQLAEARAEIERLRQALKQIVTWATPEYGGEPKAIIENATGDGLYSVEQYAQRVLEGGPA